MCCACRGALPRAQRALLPTLAALLAPASQEKSSGRTEAAPDMKFDPEMESAALRIQSMHRGKQVRRNLQELRPPSRAGALHSRSIGPGPLGFQRTRKTLALATRATLCAAPPPCRGKPALTSPLRSR